MLGEYASVREKSILLFGLVEAKNSRTFSKGRCRVQEGGEN